LKGKIASEDNAEFDDILNGYGVVDAAPSSKDSLVSAQARLSVSIPRGVYKRFKLLAHDREMTVSALLLHLIKAELQ
jgi:hypothetical protein